MQATITHTTTSGEQARYAIVYRHSADAGPSCLGFYRTKADAKKALAARKNTHEDAPHNPKWVTLDRTAYSARPAGGGTIAVWISPVADLDAIFPDSVEEAGQPDPDAYAAQQEQAADEAAARQEEEAGQDETNPHFADAYDPDEDNGELEQFTEEDAQPAHHAATAQADDAGHLHYTPIRQAVRPADLQPAPTQNADTEHSAHAAGYTWHVGIHTEHHTPTAGTHQIVTLAYFKKGSRPSFARGLLRRLQQREIGTGRGTTAIAPACYQLEIAGTTHTIIPATFGYTYRPSAQNGSMPTIPTLTQAIAEAAAQALIR